MGKNKEKRGGVPESSKAKKGQITPRPKRLLRDEEFYCYDWAQLRLAIGGSFLLACCDQGGWDYEPADVLGMELLGP